MKNMTTTEEKPNSVLLWFDRHFEVLVVDSSKLWFLFVWPFFMIYIPHIIFENRIENDSNFYAIYKESYMFFVYYIFMAVVTSRQLKNLYPTLMFLKELSKDIYLKLEKKEEHSDESQIFLGYYKVYKDGRNAFLTTFFIYVLSILTFLC